MRRALSAASGLHRLGALAGIRVIDLTRVVAGPFCSMLLGDLGAEVIKIEKPGEGDDSRSYGPPFLGKESVYFMAVNRNKKSVAVNIKSEAGQGIIKKLVKKSDVLIENYVPGKLDALGLGYASLSDLNPGLIYCSMTGFGPTGPYAGRGGYDTIVSAMGGLMHITGPLDGDPVKVGVPVTNMTMGLYAHGAIMAALIQRQRSGLGQRVNCNLLSSQVAMLIYQACNYLNAGIEGQRLGSSHSILVPYQSFATSDSHIVVGVGNNSQFHSLCKRMSLPDLPGDEKFSTNPARVENRKELIEILTKRFSEHSTSYWLAAFKDCACPHGSINSLQQVFDHPQVEHLGLVQEVSHSTAGVVRMPGPAVSYSSMDQPARLPPPTLGEHTIEVLHELLGYSRQQIEELQRTGIVG